MTLGYRSNATAKALRERVAELVGFIGDEVASAPFAGEIVEGAQERAWQDGQLLLVVNTGGRRDLEQAAVEQMLSHRSSPNCRQVLIYSSLHGELTQARREAGERGGVWSVPVDCATGPYDITKAARLTDESLYAGRLLKDRDGTWWLFAFNHVDSDGRFIGSLSDPLPVGWDANGRLRVTGGRFDHLA
ncbi:hypothetical protein L600_002200000220 [Isoptericola variabilis J7]|nr:hypothetical protein L600_002200000220 [Isoptericola variabilis J7]